MGYSGDRPQNATLVNVEIVRKPKDQVGFAVHPKRWVVERFFAYAHATDQIDTGEHHIGGPEGEFIELQVQQQDRDRRRTWNQATGQA